MGGGPVLKRDYLNKYNSEGVCMVEMTSTRLYVHFKEMREEILKHKWYESEKAHQDVGFEFALLDWILKHKADWDKKHPC